MLVTGETWVQATDSALTEHTRIASQCDRVYVLDLQAGTVQRLDARGRPDLNVGGPCPKSPTTGRPSRCSRRPGWHAA